MRRVAQQYHYERFMWANEDREGCVRDRGIACISGERLVVASLQRLKQISVHT